VEAIVAPHPGTSFTGRTITFATNNGADVKTYTIPDAMTFESGKVYNYTVTYSNTTPQEETSSYDGKTNCYIVAPNGTVTFEVSRAYTYNAANKVFNNTLHVGGTYTGGFVAKVIWQDPSDLIDSPTSTASAISGSGNTATVTVTAKNNKSGNAVIGIYKSTDTSTPVWSYHIWVTDYTGAATATNNGFVFMNRNLGATAAGTGLTARGLFYQWGRKDPFPGEKTGTAGYAERAKFYGINDTGFNTAEVKVTGSDNAACIIESIQKPTTFFTNYNNNYDWLITLKDDLWNIRESNKDIKTIYDPCPSGWRVPAHKDNSASANNSPWKGYTGSSFTSGDTGAMSFGANAVYPAAGGRSYSRGSASNGGSYGYYWSASPYSSSAIYAAHLIFNSGGGISVYYNNVRANGFSVRCVRE
jgi:uncharacterized protein (TIGR02145 family)